MAVVQCTCLASISLPLPVNFFFSYDYDCHNVAHTFSWQKLTMHSVSQEQSEVISSSSALMDKTEEAAAFKYQLEQLRLEFAQHQVTGAASAAQAKAAAQARAAVQQQLTLEQQQHAVTKQRLVLLEAHAQQSSSASPVLAQVYMPPCAPVHLLHTLLLKDCQAPDLVCEVAA